MDELKSFRDARNYLKTLDSLGILISGHTDAVSCIDCSDDLAYVVTGSNDSSVRVWDGKTCRQLHKHNFHLAAVNSVSISTDSQYVASGSSDKTVAVFSLKTASVVHTFQGHKRMIHCVKFTPDLNYLVSTAADRTIKVFFDLNDLQFHTNIHEHLGSVSALDINENHLSTGDSKGKICIWRLEDFSKFGAVMLQARIILLKLAENSGIFAFSADFVVSLIDPQSLTVIRSISTTDAVLHIQVRHETAILYRENNVLVWNPENHETAVNEFNDYRHVASVCSKPDFFVAGFIDRTVKVFDLRGNLQLTMQGHLGHIEIIKTCPGNSKLVTSANDYTIRFWNISEKSQESSVLVHKNDVKSIRFTNTGKFMVSFCENDVAFVWKVGEILSN